MKNTGAFTRANDDERRFLKGIIACPCLGMSYLLIVNVEANVSRIPHEEEQAGEGGGSNRLPVDVPYPVLHLASQKRNHPVRLSIPL